jgi:hypothetical protein
MIHAARLDWGVSWKSQRPQKLSKLINAVKLSIVHQRKRADLNIQIEETHPLLRQFRNSWATIFLLKEAFTGRKAYMHSKNSTNSYRSKRRQMVLASKHSTGMDIDVDDRILTDGGEADGDGDGDELSPSEDDEVDNGMVLAD